MIFKPRFVDMILAGVKTQTRRPNRGYYKVGHTYSVQPCRTCKGIAGIGILMEDIHEEIDYEWFVHSFYEKGSDMTLMPVTQKEADAEGYEDSFSFEVEFRELYPKWDQKIRWAFVYHLVRL